MNRINKISGYPTEEEKFNQIKEKELACFPDIASDIDINPYEEANFIFDITYYQMNSQPGDTKIDLIKENNGRSYYDFITETASGKQLYYANIVIDKTPGCEMIYSMIQEGDEVSTTGIKSVFGKWKTLTTHAQENEPNFKEVRQFSKKRTSAVDQKLSLKKM